jgi:hypothetical protein
MIPLNIIYVSIGMGIFFFIFIYLRFYQKIHISSSLIAGFSLTYMFLDIIPNIIIEYPELPSVFASPPFFFILIGFSVQHITEKLILQRVDKYTQIQARELIEKEKNLENTEHNYEIALAKEGVKKELDQEVIQTFANYIFLIQDQEEELTEHIIELEHKISVDISKDLINLRFISDFFYEFLIGIALVEIMSGDITSGIIFFIFAFLNAIIANKKHHEKIFTDLDIEAEFSESKFQKILTSLSILLGIIVGIIFNLVFEVELEMTFMILSFISGLILHEIMHHMPEKEKGNGLYFILGMLIFLSIYFISRLFY